MKNKDIVKINLEDEKEDDKESFKKTFKEMPIKNIVRKKIPKNKKSRNHKKIHVQGKKKLLTSFHISPEINLSAQDLIENIRGDEDFEKMEDCLGTAEDLINQAEKLIESSKEEKESDEIPDIELKIQKEVKKEVMEGNVQDINFSDKLFNLEKCPVCSGKLRRARVEKRNNTLFQTIKCKNKNCNYEKEIMILL
jgi:hypothetical protein